MCYNLIHALAPPCIQNEVQLLRDRVQICHNEVWGYVCDDFSLSNDDASVICRQLGLLPQGGILILC